MVTRRRRSLRDAMREHQDALEDLEAEVNMMNPEEIPAAARRERQAHADLLRARQADSRRRRASDARSDGNPPAR